MIMLFAWLLLVGIIGLSVNGHNMTSRGCGRKFCGVATGRSTVTLSNPGTQTGSIGGFLPTNRSLVDRGCGRKFCGIATARDIVTTASAPFEVVPRACGYKFCNLVPKRGCGRKYCAVATAKRALGAISDQLRSVVRAGCGRKFCGFATARELPRSGVVESTLRCNRRLARSGTLFARCCDHEYCQVPA
jgi:hypothetical protein